MRSNTKVSLVVVLALFVLLIPARHVLADRYEEQINELRQQNSQTAAADAALELQERNLQEVIARLQGEIAAIQKEIGANEAKRTELADKIKAAEAELERQRQTLGESLKMMYVDGQMSTLEMLATSNDLSHFVDKEEYANSIQRKITGTMQEISRLQAELINRRETVDKFLADQQSMRQRLAAQQAEQDRLLALNVEQQSAYEAQLQQNNDKIGELRRQQAAENARLSGGRTIGSIPDTSGYPWANAPFPNSIVDPWGMFQRQCVSYTAWKVWKSGRHMPYWGGIGNANQWDDNARDAGIPVDKNPRKGDVAVSNAGTYGHVMYVEQVSSDGSIYVSDYNQQFDGNYREYWISADTVRSKNLLFVHF